MHRSTHILGWTGIAAGVVLLAYLLILAVTK
jgi:hypothetical protein